MKTENETLIALWLSLLLTLLFASTVPPSIGAVPLAVPAISLNPTSGPPGTLVTVTGSGYTPGGYTSYIQWDGITIKSFSIPSGGNFTTNFNVPSGASLGSHTVTVCASCGDPEFEQTASAPFTVTPTATSTPTSVCQGDEQMSFDPPAPLEGQEVIVSVTSSKAHVNVDLQGPYPPTFVEAVSGGLGYIWRWRITVEAPGVAEYRFYAQGVLCATGSFNAGAVPTVTPTFTPTPIPVEITPCDLTGVEGEVLIDFEDFGLGALAFPEEAVAGVAHFVGDNFLTAIDPAVPTHSESKALMNDPREPEFGSIGQALRIQFDYFQEFVGVFIGINEQQYLGSPATATLTAYGIDGEVLGTDTAEIGPEATPIMTCLSVEAPGIFEVTIEYDNPAEGGVYEPEVIDDLVLRGPTEPEPIPADDQPPVVNIEMPTDGATIIERSFRLEGIITEDRRLEEVRIYINGVFYREIGFSRLDREEYSFALDPIREVDLEVYVENTMEVRAIDAAGNTGSDTVRFRFEPPPTPTPTPTLDIIADRAEITQAIQCLDDPVCGADGSVVLVTGKPTLVRLYVRSEGAAGEVPNISGEICRGDDCRPSLNRITVSPTDDPVRDYRDDLTRTLNFLLPPEWSSRSGRAELHIYVNRNGVDAGECCLFNNSLRYIPFFNPSKRLDIVMVRVRVSGFVPSARERWITLDYFELVYPTSDIRIWMLEHDAVLIDGDDWDLTDTSGDGCGDEGWSELLDDLWDLNWWTDDPADWTRYYGMADHRAPHGYHGCGARPGDESGGFVNTTAGEDVDGHAHTVAWAGEIMAQEIGHNHGLRHANDSGNCGAANPDRGYPVGTDDAGTTGMPILDAWGTDVEDMALYQPDSSYDFMGYCGADEEIWVSAYTYRNLYNNLRRVALAPDFEPSHGSVLARPASQGQEVLVGSVFVTPETARLRHGFYRMPLPADQEIPPGDEGLYTVELRDADENILIARLFNPREESNHEPGETGIFQIIVPWQPGTAQILILHEGTPLLTVPVSLTAPTVTLLFPNGGEAWPATGTQTIRWEGTDPDGDTLTYKLQYSTDGGQTWSLLATDTTATSFEVDVANLAGSDQARIRVWATDGVNTAFDESDAVFSVAAKEPDVFIASPEEGGIFPTGEQVIFQGFATDLEDGSIEDGPAYVWTSDRDGQLSTGQAIWGLPLSAGQHTITLTVSDSDGNAASHSITITVAPEGALPPEQAPGIDPLLLLVLGGGLLTLLLAGALVLRRRNR